MGINGAFLEYDTNFYTSSCPSVSTSIPNPLESLFYPKIVETTTNGLGDPITTLEIQNTIQSMQNKRSPGPDGFTVEF